MILATEMLGWISAQRCADYGLGCRTASTAIGAGSRSAGRKARLPFRQHLAWPFCMNREPLAECVAQSNAQMATGMITRIARRTRREWFLTPVQPGTFRLNPKISRDGCMEKT